jgi:hypothetical protein
MVDKQPGQPVASEGEADRLEPQRDSPATGLPARSPLDRLVRLDRRRRLRRALDGTSDDRWAYALGRSVEPCQAELMLRGTCTVDVRACAVRARRWFYRLEAMARARHG